MPNQFELISHFFAQQHSTFSNQTFYFRHDHLTIRHFTSRIKAKLSTVFQWFQQVDASINYDTLLTSAVLQAVVEAQAWSFIEEEPITFQQLTQQLIAQTKPSPQQKGTLRSPFVTILGHVDHGKTTLLEQLCQMSVCPNEPGNITQHIGVYEVLLQPPSAGGVIFIDTPGHALFTKMRLHGTNATDIALLVVSAVDGVQPQTIESINHARAANIKVIVFINKMDLPNANSELVMQQLTRYGLVAEARGGDTMMLSGSALRNEGIIPLVEAISLLGEVLDLRALLSTPASGVVLESYHNVQQGYVATLLIHNGTLKVRDYLMAGHVVGRVRAIYNNKKKQVRQMTAGNAVTVTGLPTLPQAGEPFIVLQDVKMAQLLTKYLIAEQKKQRQQTKVNINFDALLLTEAEKQSQKAHLNLVVKADTANTLQALTAMIDNLKLTHKTLEVVHAGVGNLNESDLLLAVASNASLIGFNIQTTTGFNNLNKNHRKPVWKHNIIYQVVDALTALDQPTSDIAGVTLTKTGVLLILKVFSHSVYGAIAGCRVLSGVVKVHATAKVMRQSEVIFTGKIISLQHVKSKITKAQLNDECGVALKDFANFMPQDQIEVFE